MVGQGRLAVAASRVRSAVGPAGRALRPAIAAGTVIGLTACGSAVPGGTGHRSPAAAGRSAGALAAGKAAGGPVCASRQRVGRVVATRSPSQARAVLPDGITISDPRQVRALAAAICALPLLPAGLHCPADLGGVVRLAFAAGQREFPPVLIQDSGCRRVTGAGPARWWSGSVRFSQLLHRTIGGPGRLAPGTHPSSVPTV